MGSFELYIIKSAVCLVLLYPPYMLLMRKDTHFCFNRATLLTIIIASFTRATCGLTVMTARERPYSASPEKKRIQLDEEHGNIGIRCRKARDYYP